MKYTLQSNSTTIGQDSSECQLIQVFCSFDQIRQNLENVAIRSNRNKLSKSLIVNYSSSLEVYFTIKLCDDWSRFVRTATINVIELQRNDRRQYQKLRSQNEKRQEIEEVRNKVTKVVPYRVQILKSFKISNEGRPDTLPYQ